MTDDGAAVHLGIVAYVWGALHQDRLLVDCLGPAAGEMRRQEIARRFWFDRNDARGPHLFAVVTVPREAARETAERLTVRLGSHLSAHPSSIVLTTEQLGARHAATRGRWQCEVDRRPGFADNNSFEIFEHPTGGYPFGLSAALPGESALWDGIADLTLWAIGRLADRPGTPAMGVARHWIASVHEELRRAGASPADYWLHHATTLLPDLFAGMEPEERAAALTELAAKGGPAHAAAAVAWEEAAAGPAWTGLPVLIAQVLGGGLPSPWPLLREIDHAVLKQLGVPAALHLPIVLQAWLRSTGPRV